MRSTRVKASSLPSKITEYTVFPQMALPEKKKNVAGRNSVTKFSKFIMDALEVPDHRDVNR